MIVKNTTKIFSIYLVILFLEFSFSHSADSLSTISNHQIQLRSYVEESKVPANRLVILHLEISWPGKLNRFQIEPVSQPILTNLLLEGSGSENRLLTLEDGSLKAIKAITYRLRPLEMGMAYIDGVVIKYIDRESGEEENLSSQRIMVEITDPLPENQGKKLRAFVYIILFAIFFTITGYFILVYIRKKRMASKSVAPIMCPAESYLNRLMQEVDPRGTNLGQMISRLSRLFKEYLEQDFRIPAKELSTKEIVEALQQLQIDENDKAGLSTVFQKLDILKFAQKNIDPNEFIHIYGAIENFLLKRKQIFDAAESKSKEVK
jgi:hypothetical protein